MASYHDVKVYVSGVEYVPSENYALSLTCTKAGGWRLWNEWKDEMELIGGEFDGGSFCITVKGAVIVGKIPVNITKPAPFGWSGVVDTNKNPPTVLGQ